MWRIHEWVLRKHAFPIMHIKTGSNSVIISNIIKSKKNVLWCGHYDWRLWDGERRPGPNLTLKNPPYFDLRSGVKAYLPLRQKITKAKKKELNFTDFPSIITMSENSHTECLITRRKKTLQILFDKNILYNVLTCPLPLLSFNFLWAQETIHDKL